ncbi:MAG: HlyD family secretion protein [Sphingobacteriia bacterium]|nr:HlyD family secretion protein [Sphingobacteriia bacterium]
MQKNSLDNIKTLIKENKNAYLKKLGFVMGCLIIAFILYYIFYLKNIISTDNAYVKGDVTPIMSKVNGYVKEVRLDDGANVKAGDILAKIEDEDYIAKFNKGKADIAEIEFTIKNLEQKILVQDIELEQSKAKLDASQADFDKNFKDYERAIKLNKTDVISTGNFDSIKARYLKAKADLETTQLGIQVSEKNILMDKNELEKAKVMLQSRNESLKLLQIDLDATSIKSPIDGVIGNRGVKKGQFVRQGSVLMHVVPLNNLWVIANFKESQIQNVKPNNKVKINVDAFPGETFYGKVEAIYPASGSEFSLLPAENATGNFTKIVQRVPVKISIKHNKGFRIVPGMSSVVKINTASGQKSK